ncbi:hypothetical protein MrNuV_ORF021 [Macrobrachium rosenbergii nudivirus]|nr:hypothetical protein MrNuV_ORF021 [Macrobrachium rosenbergii nudivirus]
MLCDMEEIESVLSYSASKFGGMECIPQYVWLDAEKHTLEGENKIQRLLQYKKTYCDGIIQYHLSEDLLELIEKNVEVENKYMNTAKEKTLWLQYCSMYGFGLDCLLCDNGKVIMNYRNLMRHLKVYHAYKIYTEFGTKGDDVNAKFKLYQEKYGRISLKGNKFRPEYFEEDLRKHYANVNGDSARQHEVPDDMFNVSHNLLVQEEETAIEAKTPDTIVADSEFEMDPNKLVSDFTSVGIFPDMELNIDTILRSTGTLPDKIDLLQANLDLFNQENTLEIENIQIDPVPPMIYAPRKEITIDMKKKNDNDDEEEEEEEEEEEMEHDGVLPNLEPEPVIEPKKEESIMKKKPNKEKSPTPPPSPRKQQKKVEKVQIKKKPHKTPEFVPDDDSDSGYDIEIPLAGPITKKSETLNKKAQNNQIKPLTAQSKNNKQIQQGIVEKKIENKKSDTMTVPNARKSKTVVVPTKGKKRPRNEAVASSSSSSSDSSDNEVVENPPQKQPSKTKSTTTPKPKRAKVEKPKSPPTTTSKGRKPRGKATAPPPSAAVSSQHDSSDSDSDDEPSKPPPKRQYIKKKIRPSAKIPRTNSKAKNDSLDRTNTYWAIELIKNLQEENVMSDVDDPTNHLKSTLVKVFSGDNIEERKKLKTVFEQEYKQFYKTHCAATNGESRINLAHWANIRVIAEYYGKKINKPNSIYNSIVLMKHYDNYMKFIYGKKQSQTKEEMEKELQEQNCNTNMINKWRDAIRGLSKLTIKGEYTKMLKVLNAEFGHVKELKCVIDALKLITVVHVENKTLDYFIKDDKNIKNIKNLTKPRALKNLVNQLIKGSVSFLKATMEDEAIHEYTKFFALYHNVKNNITMSKVVKWFMHSMTLSLKDITNPLNSFTRISKTRVENTLKTFLEFKINKNNPKYKPDDNLFTAGFHANLTIFCMKYIYNIYEKILDIYKTYPNKLQCPHLFHVGLFQTAHANVNVKTCLLDPTFQGGIHNTKNKADNTLFSIPNDKIANCIFQMKLVASNLPIREMKDVKDAFATMNVEILNMLDSKCNVAVYGQIKLMLINLLYNVACNIIETRTQDSILFKKKINWNFFKSFIFNSKFYEYPGIATNVIDSFSTLVTKSEQDVYKYTDDDKYVLDNSEASWDVIATEHKIELFNELFKSEINIAFDDEEDIGMCANPELEESKNNNDDDDEEEDEGVGDDEDEIAINFDDENED